jgi:methionine-rich copper-binding protein CopC
MVARFLILCALIGITTGPAWACGILDHAEPRVGSNVSGPLSNLKLTFSEAIVPAKSSIELDEIDTGKPVESKPFVMSENDTVMSLTTLQPLPPGKYKVHWRVEWKDCGSITDSRYPFMLVP